jgi:hypothetical protein
MKWLFLILVCLALIGCVPVEAAEIDTATDLPATPQVVVSTVEVSTIVEGVILPQSTGGHVEIIGGDEESLREFIQRYLSPIYPGAEEGETKVLIGNLPDDLPVDLPLPENARIVATVQQSSGFTQVILEAMQTPDEAEAFYNQSLVDLGWQPAQLHQEGSGFVSSNQGERFCLDEGDAYLELLFLERIEGRTEVRLTLQSPVVYNFCQEGDPGYMDPGSSLIPALEAPPDVQTSGSGAGSSSDGSAYSTTDLLTSLSIDALLAHYNDQMEQAGWELVDQGTSEVVAWSAWKLIDEAGDEWGGNLIVMDNRLGSDRRFAIVSVEQVK